MWGSNLRVNIFLIEATVSVRNARCNPKKASSTPFEYISLAAAKHVRDKTLIFTSGQEEPLFLKQNSFCRTVLLLYKRLVVHVV